MIELSLPFNSLEHNDQVLAWCGEQFGSQSDGRWWCYSGSGSTDVLSFEKVAKMFFQFDREEDAILFLLRWR